MMIRCTKRIRGFISIVYTTLGGNKSMIYVHCRKFVRSQGLQFTKKKIKMIFLILILYPFLKHDSALSLQFSC